MSVSQANRASAAPTCRRTRARYNVRACLRGPISNTKPRRRQSVGCYVVTVSDTRTEDTDTGGRAIVELLTAAGHRVVGRSLVRDDPEQLRDAIGRQLANPDVQVIITTGGTGITSRDCTFEAVNGML